MRTVWLLGVGGCLLGWEPEPAETYDSGEPPVFDCELPPDDEPCATFDERNLAIGGSLTPEFTSNLGISDIYVYRERILIWHAWTDDLHNSRCSFVYGEVPAGVSESSPAQPLVAGTAYEVKLDSLCESDDVSSRYQAFTAEDR